MRPVAESAVSSSRPRPVPATDPTASPRSRPAAPAPVPFGPGSSMWDDMGDVFFLALTPAAFVLQGMHPVISAAVDRHSVFRTDPGGRAIRSLDSMMLWVYGGERAIAEGERLRVMHRPIHGRDEDGEPYAALDPEAYAWVHGTAYVTAMTVFPLLHGRPPTPDEQVTLYDEHLQLGRILRVPERELPQTVEAYWDYYAAMVRDRLRRTKVADELVRSIERPRVRLVPGPLDPLGRLAGLGASTAMRLLTYGAMTPDAREVLGVRWSAADDVALRGLMTVARPIRSRLPEYLRYVPLARHARARERELERARRRMTVEVRM